MKLNLRFFPRVFQLAESRQNVSENGSPNPPPRIFKRGLSNLDSWHWPKVIWNQSLEDPEDPYLIRWVVDFGKFSIRLHHWLGSDDLRAPHDHGWDFISCLLFGEMWDRVPGSEGGYIGETPFTEIKRKRFRFEKFSAEHRHSVRVGKNSAWTLLFTGPVRREWGFWVPRGDNGKVRFRHRNKYFRIFGHHLGPKSNVD